MQIDDYRECSLALCATKFCDVQDNIKTIFDRPTKAMFQVQFTKYLNGVVH